MTYIADSLQDHHIKDRLIKIQIYLNREILKGSFHVAYQYNLHDGDTISISLWSHLLAYKTLKDGSYIIRCSNHDNWLSIIQNRLGDIKNQIQIIDEMRHDEDNQFQQTQTEKSQEFKQKMASVYGTYTNNLLDSVIEGTEQLIIQE